MPPLVRPGNIEVSLPPSCSLADNQLDQDPPGGEQLWVAWRTCHLLNLEVKGKAASV